METSNTFSIKRIALLMQRHVFYNLKTYLLSFAAFGSILIVISLLNTYTNGNIFSEDLFATLGVTCLVIGGLLLTSNIFKEISSKHRGWLYMMLPTNPSEKILAYWLLTTVGYVVISTLTLIISSIIISLFSTLIFKTTFYVFNPFTVDYLEILIQYCVGQSLFFFGAIFFQKNHFIKTILSVFVFYTILGVIGVLIVYLTFGSLNIDSSNLQLMNYSFFTETLPYTAKLLYYGLMVPFFLTVSYFKFKEREA